MKSQYGRLKYCGELKILSEKIEASLDKIKNPYKNYTQPPFRRKMSVTTKPSVLIWKWDIADKYWT